MIFTLFPSTPGLELSLLPCVATIFDISLGLGSQMVRAAGHFITLAALS